LAEARLRGGGARSVRGRHARGAQATDLNAPRKFHRSARPRAGRLGAGVSFIQATPSIGEGGEPFTPVLLSRLRRSSPGAPAAARGNRGGTRVRWRWRDRAVPARLPGVAVEMNAVGWPPLAAGEPARPAVQYACNVYYVKLWPYSGSSVAT